MVVIAVDENRHKRVVWMHREKGMSFNDQIDKIMGIEPRYNPIIVELRTNNFAQAFHQCTKEISDLPIKPFTMSRMRKGRLFTLFNCTLSNDI